MNILIIENNQFDIDRILNSSTSVGFGPRISFTFARNELDIYTAAEIAEKFDAIIIERTLVDSESNAEHYTEYAPELFRAAGFTGSIVANSSEANDNKILMANGADTEKDTDIKDDAVLYAVIGFIHNLTQSDPTISRVTKKITNLALWPTDEEVKEFLDEVNQLEIDPVVMERALSQMFLSKGSKAVTQTIFQGAFKAEIEAICISLLESRKSTETAVPA